MAAAHRRKSPVVANLTGDVKRENDDRERRF
jgi:hypothetical protein